MQSHRPRGVSWMFAAMLAVACTSGSVRHEFKNQGLLCLFPASETMAAPVESGATVRTYAADQPVNVAVQFLTCLPCGTEQLMATCSIDASSGTLQVTSKGSFEQVDPPSNMVCVGICRFFVAHCATASLPAGAYTFKHGTDTLSLTVPSSGETPCIGAPAASN
jgi:hypothetical protein